MEIDPTPTTTTTTKSELFVTKRNGEKEVIMPEKIMERLQKLAFETGETLNKDFIKIDTVVDKVVDGMYPGVTTEKLDDLCAETCAYMNIVHPDYSKLAARIAISNLHKETKDSFFEIASILRHYKDICGNPAPLLAEDVFHIIEENRAQLEGAIRYDRDFNYDFFGFKTLEKSYLLKIDGRIAERPQHMLMRVSVGIHKQDIEGAIRTYNYMSEKWFTHATPTLFNAGTPCPQMSSCFLLNIQGDSIEGIYDTLKQTAQISKSAGGIGISISKIRAAGSYIRGTNGTSNGIVPMLRVFNDTARYVDQGGGKRKGSFAMYLEPWHADVFDFLNLKKNHGKEEQRARDLFFGLWTPDLFMERVQGNADWTLMCPNECPGLEDVWGAEFNELYTKYENEGRGRRTIKAQELWQAIVDSQTETGTPYMCYKDQANRKSNQQNLGTIKSSNLCTEIIEYTAPDEVAVCNLASINLQKFVKEDGSYDYETLCDVAQTVTRNLNKVIDLNFYPVKEARYSNMRHRPIGIGVQGLADAFQRMKIAFESQEAMDVNEKIFETIYFGAMTASKDIAKELGPYTTYEGCPVSKGQFQFDMWDYTPRFGYDWEALKAEVAKYGVRNSLLIAPMPTASTSQILGNNESFEPYTSNIFTRRVLSGEFVVLNPHLVKDLIAMKLWNNDIKNQIIGNNGSIQGINKIPAKIQEIYKTIWEVKQKTLIDLARARAPFIDQSQSLNVYMSDPSYSKLSSMHFYGWKAGLKTGMYYLRSRPAADAIKFTVDVESLLKANNCDIKANKEEADAAAAAGLKDSTNTKTVTTGKKRKIEVTKPTKEEMKAACDNYDDENDICLSCGS